jgi:hypothetical protein
MRIGADNAQTRATYQDFLNLWKDAAPDPILKEPRTVREAAVAEKNPSLVAGCLSIVTVIGVSTSLRRLFAPLPGSMHYERTPRFRRLKLRVALAALQTQDG